MSRPYSLLVLALLVAGGFVVVTTFAFAPGTAAAITFGVSIATALAAVAAAVAAPTRAAAALLGSSVLVSAWTVLVSLGIFSGATQTWLLFAGGAAVAATALGAAVADDLRDSRAGAVTPVGIRAA